MKITFDNNTDYTKVYKIVKLMFGEISNSGDPCCFTPDINDSLCCGSIQIEAAQIALDAGSDARFRKAVESAYNCLKYWSTAKYEIADTYVSYYGNQATSAIPDLATILASDDQSFVHNQGITIPFVYSATLVYSWVAYPVGEPLKTHWQDTVIPTNFGDIGTGADLFGAATIVGDFRVIITNYVTQFDNPILFT